jgi:uroporphyrinogen decarboxylase
MTEMTSRERVALALDHKEPDRIPLDIGGGNSTTLHVEAYENLVNHIGAEQHTVQVGSKVDRTTIMSDEILVALGSDIRPIRIGGFKNWVAPNSEPDTIFDEFGIKWRRVGFPGGFYWEVMSSPLAEAKLSDLDSFSWPDPDDPGLYEDLEEEANKLFHETTYAIMGDCGYKGFWEPYFLMRGLEQALIDLVQNKEFFHRVMGILLDINSRVADRFLEIAGLYLSVFRTSDDLATQRSLMMSPSTYREMIKPYHKEFFNFIKQRTNAKIFYHSCGNIDVGVEILNPVQVSAITDPAALKVRFGDRLSFWGAIDTQRVLPAGTPLDVEREVKLRINQFAKGGGYIAAAVHNIQPDVPPENIIALRDAVLEYGWYPLSRN